MSSHSAPPFAAIIVAAGKGLRAGQSVPKQFAQWRGKPLVRHSAQSLLDAGAQQLVVVIPPAMQDLARAALPADARITFVDGGAERQDSVNNALEQLASSDAPQNVLIHDAARPDLDASVIARLLSALASHPGAIPVLPVVDSIAVAGAGDIMTGSAERDALKRVQTPQAFRFADILAAHRNWLADAAATDDAQVLRAAGGSVALVEGDERLKKVTFAEDFQENAPMMRIGQGYDVHRLADGEELWLGGIRIDHHRGLAGHSDADVALHAIVDAVLGAIGAGDIGTHFPPSEPQWRGARSAQFVEHAAKLVAEAGFVIGNVDLTIICEAPKIGPHRAAMRSAIASMLGVQEDQVSIKATTTEKLGFTGRGEGIAAQAIAIVGKSGM